MSDERPVLRIVRGNPDEAELAALTAVLAAAAGGAAATDPGPSGARRSGWADRSATLRMPLRPGAGAWRASGLPR